jgi:glutathione reductase (NADPH)
MTTFDYDFFVIGGGSGGVRAARMAATRGQRVALAERDGVAGLGGTCVNVGCIPKKLYRYAADYAHAFAEAPGFGWSLDTPRFDWATLKAQRRAEISRLNGVYARLLDGAGVTTLTGTARLIDPHTVSVTDSAGQVTQHRAAHILIAVGGWPQKPDFPGAELAISSNEIFDIEPLPKRLLVVGGGYIACEFASIFNDLGCTVTQLHRGEKILRGFDEDIRDFTTDELRKSGLDIRTNITLAKLSRESGALGEQLSTTLSATLSDGSTIAIDTVLIATGRRPRIADIGLSDAGVRVTEAGAIAVDASYATNVPHIYAVGDVIDRVALTPVALAEAMCVVDHITSGTTARRVNYTLIPSAVFTHPAIASVGLSEAAARAAGHTVTIFRSEFRPLRHTLSGSTERTLMKLIVCAHTDRVLGVHMVGDEAGDILQGFAVALTAGATKAQFDATIGIHPSAAEEFVTMREPVRS